MDAISHTDVGGFGPTVLFNSEFVTVKQNSTLLKGVHILIPGICKSVTLQKDFADGEVIPDVLDGPSVITRVLKSGRGIEESRGRPDY